MRIRRVKTPKLKPPKRDETDTDETFEAKEVEYDEKKEDEKKELKRGGFAARWDAVMALCAVWVRRGGEERGRGAKGRSRIRTMKHGARGTGNDGVQGEDDVRHVELGRPAASR